MQLQGVYKTTRTGTRTHVGCGLIVWQLFAALVLCTLLLHVPTVESGLFFQGCGEKPGIFKLAQRTEVPLAVMLTIEQSGNGPKARCKLPFNVLCLPSAATCEFGNQCCSEKCEEGKCTEKQGR